MLRALIDYAKFISFIAKGENDMFIMQPALGEEIGIGAWRHRVKVFCNYWLRPSTQNSVQPVQPTMLCSIQYTDPLQTVGTFRCLFLASLRTPTGTAESVIIDFHIPNVNRAMWGIITDVLRKRNQSWSVKQIADQSHVSTSRVYEIRSKKIGKRGLTKLPSKEELVRIAYACRFPFEKLEELLLQAGYALSPSLPFDRAVEECFRTKQYPDFDKILEKYGLNLKKLKLFTKRNVGRKPQDKDSPRKCE